MKINYDSLLFKIILVIISILAVFLIFFIETMKLTKQTLEHMEQTKVESAIQSNIPSIVDAIYFGFEKPIEDIGNVLLAENSNIIAILIKAENGKNYLFVKDKNPFKEKIEDVVYETFSIDKDDKAVGELEIAYNLTLSKHHFNEYKESAIIFALFIIFSIIIAMRYLYKKIKSLHILAEKLRNFDLQKMKAIEAPDTFYEIRYVTYAINKLLKQINDYADNLKISNRLLIENKKRLMDAQRIAQMASWTYFPSTKEIDVSREFYRLLEIDAKKKKIDVNYIINAIHPDDKNLFVNILKNSVKKGSRFDFIHKIVTERGRVKHLHTEGRVRKSKDAPVEIVGVSMDVTDEIEAKMQAEHMHFMIH